MTSEKNHRRRRNDARIERRGANYEVICDKLDRKLSELGIKTKDEDSKKVTDEVFDETTLLALYKLVNRKVISSLGGSISTGKEANVFAAKREGNDTAVKIYRIRTGNFTKMSEYVLGDPRFAGIRKTHKDLIFAWTKKEFANLSRAREANIPCPMPYAFDRNILIMEFLGKDGVAYPKLKDVTLQNPKKTYEEAVALICGLYQKAKLIHGDLSEYNILCRNEGLILIDMAQAVTKEHPSAYRFLFRDIKNINRFFKNKCETKDEHEIFRSIVGEEFFEI